MDQAVLIVSLEKTPSVPKLILHKENCQRVFNSARNSKIALVSVVGAKGTGKSFLLSCIVRFLQQLELEIDFETEDWLFPPGNPALHGFKFESSNEVVTSGIYVWPKPFVVSDDNDEDISLFFMDTRGIFEEMSGMREWAGIVGTALALSTCTIFNVSKNLQEDSLVALETFLEYVKMVLGADKSFQDSVKATSSSQKVCQKIMFLVRDWNNPGEHKYGLDGGRDYICNKLDKQDEMVAESIRIRESINSGVDAVDCFLMPHPGVYISAIEHGKPLDPDCMQEQYVFYLKQFVETFLVPENMQAKRFDNVVATGAVLAEKMEDFLTIFNNTFTQPINVASATAVMHNQMAITNELQFYNETLKRKIQKKDTLKSSYVTEKHLELKPYVLERFKNRPNYGGETSAQFLASLEQSIEAAYRNVLSQMQKQSIDATAVAEKSALEFATSELEQLSLNEKVSNNLFEQAWDQIRNAAQRQFERQLKRHDDSLKSAASQQLESSLNQLYAKVKRQNEQKVEEFLAENDLAISQALDMYIMRMDRALGVTQSIASSFDDNKFQSAHDTSLKAALEALHRKTKVPPEATDLANLLHDKLQSNILPEYKKYKQINEDNMQEIQQTLDDYRSEILSTYQAQVSQIVNSNLPFASIKQKLNEIYKKTCNDVQNKVRVMALMADRDTLAQFQQQLLGELKSGIESCQVQLELKVKEREQAEHEMLTSLQNQFQEETKKLLNEPLELDSCQQQLNQLKQVAINYFQEFLRQNESTREDELRGSLSRKLEEISNDAISLNSSKIHELHKSIVDFQAAAEREFKDLMKRKLQQLSSTSDLTRESFQGSQFSISSQCQRNFEKKISPLKLSSAKTQKVIQDLVATFKSQSDELFSEFEAQMEETLERLAGELDTLAVKTFRKKLIDFVEEFDFITEDEFSSVSSKAIKGAKDKINDRLEEERTLDSSRSEQIILKMEKKLKDVAQQIWSDDVVTKNADSERKFMSKVNTIKSSYRGEGKESLITTLIKQFKFSDEDEKKKYRNMMRAELDRADLEMKAAKNQETQKLLEAQKTHLTEFKQKAKEVADNESKLQELINNYKIKFELIASGHYDFISSLVSDMENEKRRLLLEHRNQQHNQRKQFRSVVDDLTDELRANKNSIGKISKEQYIQEGVRQLKERLSRQGLDSSTYNDEQFLDDLADMWESIQAKNDALEIKPMTAAEIDKISTTAVSLYKAEMDEHFKVPKYFLPQNLAELHRKLSRESITKANRGRLGTSVENQVHAALDKAFNEYDAKNKMNTPTSVAIGIDLGTTYCCVGAYINGKVEIIPNSIGKKTTPSYVYFGPSGAPPLVGDEAKSQSFVYPERTIYEVKRLIGRKFDDPAIKGDIEKWPFQVVQERGKPKILIEDKTHHPEEISSKILIHMKKIAEDHLKQPVTAAVITVPAYFTDGQRAATKTAGEAAGLDILRIINEPTAAAIAYNLNWTKNSKASRGLVYDLGGGTFDVALYSASEGSIDILNVGGDTHLGGVDFDNEMVNFCVEEFKRSSGIDLLAGQNSSNLTEKQEVNRKLMRLKKRCEEYKIQLSDNDQITVSIDAIHKAHDMNVTITRSQFESMIEKHIKKSLECVESVLRDGKLTKNDIAEIVLIGGSTRIPKVQSMLQTYFGKPLSTNVNPDEAVAIGAAFDAAVLNGAKAQARGDVRAAAIAPKGITIKDVTPMPYGLEIEGGAMVVLIPKQSKVPVSVTKNFLTSYNNQTSVEIVMYEGDHPKAVQNTKVGEFYLNGIPPGLAGKNTIQVTMEVNNEGIINLSATCVENGVKKTLTVRANKNRMTAKEIKAISAH